MRYNFPTWTATSLWLLLILCHAQTHDFSLLPGCAVSTVNRYYPNITESETNRQSSKTV